MARLSASGAQTSAVPPPSASGVGSADQGMHLTTSRHGRTAVVCVEGEVDLGSAGDLHGTVVSLVDAGAYCLVLDLGRVSFLDCSGIRVLVTARDLTASRGGWLRLNSVPAGVRRVLQLTMTHQLLEPMAGDCA